MAPLPLAKGEQVLRAILGFNLLPSFTLMVSLLGTSSRWEVNVFGAVLLIPMISSALTSLVYFAIRRKQDAHNKSISQPAQIASRVILSPPVDFVIFALYIGLFIPYASREINRLEYRTAIMVVEMFFTPFIVLSMYIHLYFVLYHFIRCAHQLSSLSKQQSIECPKCGHSVTHSGHGGPSTRIVDGGHAYSALGDSGPYRDEEDAIPSATETSERTREQARVPADGERQGSNAVEDVDVDDDAVPRQSFETQVGEETSLLKL